MQVNPDARVDTNLQNKIYIFLELLSWSVSLINLSSLILFVPLLTLPYTHTDHSSTHLFLHLKKSCWLHYRGPVLCFKDAVVGKDCSYKKQPAFLYILSPCFSPGEYLLILGDLVQILT